MSLPPVKHLAPPLKNMLVAEGTFSAMAIGCRRITEKAIAGRMALPLVAPPLLPHADQVALPPVSHLASPLKDKLVAEGTFSAPMTRCNRH